MGSFTRRGLLTALVAVAAGCTGQSDPESATPTGDRTSTGTPRQTRTPTPSPTATEEATATDKPVPVREWPEAFYQGPLVSAHEHMHGRTGYSIIRDDPERLMTAMERNKVDQVMAISADRYMNQVAEHDDRLIPFAFGWQETRNVDEAAESFAERLDRFPAYDGLGEIGLKKFSTPEGEPPTRADHPEMMEVYELAAERDVPVMLHTGAPWRWDDDQEDEWDGPSDFPGIQALDNAIEQNRDTDFLVHASYMWDDMPDGEIVAEKLEQYPNLYYDISPTGPKLMYGEGEFTQEEFEAAMGENGVQEEIERHYEEYAAILEEYSDRVLWGIDAAAEWHYREWAFDKFIDIGRGVLGRLPQENARDIAYRTAEDLFDINVPENEY